MTIPAPFQPGPRLLDGGQVNNALAAGQASFDGPITATPGGTVATSKLITDRFTEIGTAAAGSGVALPAAVPGASAFVANAGANAVQVFARGGSTINATAGATGLALAAGASAIFFCARNGRWNRILSA